MTHRMLSASLLILLVLTLPQMVLADVETIIHEGTIDPGSYSWTQLDNGRFQIELQDGRPLGMTDEAELPALDLLLLVPANLSLSDIRVEPLETRFEELPGPLATCSALVSSTGQELPIRDLQAVDGVFPEVWGQNGGEHLWRGFKMLAVTVHPFRVHEETATKSARLEVMDRYVVKAQTQGALEATPLTRQRQVPGERARTESTLRWMVDNPEVVASYQREDGLILEQSGSPYLPLNNPDLEGSGVRYLIVTSEELADGFQRLADFRTAAGLPAKVVTREWIEQNYRQGADFQETLRIFLKDAYALWGVEYLLIGGDTEIIPPRIIRSHFYPFGGHTDVPTDIYYAGLDGTWNANGNGWYGDPYVSDTNPGDAADLAPELAVGRAPVRDEYGVEVFVDKIIAFESIGHDADWANRILYATEVLFPSPYIPGMTITLDGGYFAKELIEDYIEPCTDMEYLRMSEVDLWPREAPLTKAALIDTLNAGHYGQFNQFGHGHFFNMSVGDANFTVSDADALTNGPHFFFLFAVNCASGAYDVSCLMERFVENPDGGSIVSIGAAREAFPSNSFGYQAGFYDYMACQGVYRVADALNGARLDHAGNTYRNTVDRWTQLNAVIIGDPAVGIWCGNPRVPSIVAPSELPVGEQNLAIRVMAGGVPVEGAEICLQKGDETYDHALTGSNGYASLRVTPHTGGNLDMVVSGAGLVRTQQTVMVNGTDTYISIADVTVVDTEGNNNGLLDAGETVGLEIELEDVGGAGADGLMVYLTANHPALQVIAGSSPVSDISPGGAGSTTGTLTVKASADTDDHTLAELKVLVVSNNIRVWDNKTNLEVLAPKPEVARLEIDDSIYGNNNGIPESGERLVILPTLKNYGTGRLDEATVTISDVAEGVTVHGGLASISGMEILEEGTISSGELSVTLDDVSMINPCGLIFVDNYEREISLQLEFNPPVTPDEPSADATLASDAIALRWDPVDSDRVHGYNVYRAAAEEGPFVRANADLLLNTSYFEDRGLDPLTPYWYKVTAVDRYMMEGDFSATISQGTMPPEMPNFPLPFQLQTSGSSAVGDVTGDGHYEVVVGSSEVYVWRDDGSELVDGDNDPQTTGPITGVAGQFGPAGIVLADLDDEPGMEIIASESSNSFAIHVYKSDGTMMPGWPRELMTSWNWATPAAGDVDGDGDLEIVVNDLSGRTFVWHHDGTELVDGDNDPSTDGVFVRRSGESWGYSSPAIFDLDGDGAGEIIFGTRYASDNALLAYRYDGTQASGFPYDTGNSQILSSPALADLDLDESMEIVFFTVSGHLHVVRDDGEDYPGFPITQDTSWDTSFGPSPAIGNFDDDPELEILWPFNQGSYSMELFLVDTSYNDGTSGDILPGWPVELPCNSEGSPVVGDLDGDGKADLLQPVGNSETHTPDMLYGFNALGEPLAGFPIAMDGHCRSTPTICDLDHDRDVDIVYASWDRMLHVWDMPTPLDQLSNTWTTFQGNAQRTGVAFQGEVTAVEEEDNLPRAFTVQAPHPNPFNPSTTIKLYVAPGADQHLEVSVFDLRGRRVRRLHSGNVEAGWHQLTWDGRDESGRGQSSGLYFLQARHAGEARTFKMTLVK